MSHHVVVLVLDSVISLDLAIVSHLFGRPASPGEATYTFAVCGLARGPIDTADGLTIEVHHGLAALEAADTIVVPGVTNVGRTLPSPVCTALRQSYDRGARVVGVSTGASILAQAGLRAGVPSALEPTRAWIDQHLAEELTVQAMAAHARMSERNFSRRFVAEYGASPLQWLLRRRIRLACEFLETTGLSVKQIAGRTGFRWAGSFREQFKQRVGMSPGDYRRSTSGRQAYSSNASAASRIRQNACGRGRDDAFDVLNAATTADLFAGFR